MIKTLRASGGDYNNLSDVFTFIQTALDTGMTEDIIVRCQGGQSFSTTAFNFYGTNMNLNGFSIIFETAPTELATPSLIDFGANINFQYDGGTWSAGPFIIRNAKVKMDCDGNVSIAAQGVLTIKNCVLCFGGATAPLALFGGSAGSVVNDCTILHTLSSGSLSAVSIAANGNVVLNNSILGVYNAANANVNFKGGVNKNNTIFNYGGGGITEVLTGGATVPNLLKVNPQTTTQGIQAENDSTATMIARDLTLATGSPCIDSADVTTSETTDILGNARG